MPENPLAKTLLQLPDWRAWLFSFRCFAAAMLAMYIAFAADMPRPYWAMASVYIASQPLSGATRSKALFRLLGTLLGATAAVILVPNLVDAPVLLSLALALWLGLCLFLSLLDRTPRSYIFLLAGYTAAIIGFPSVTAPGQIFDVAVARVQEISLGIVCATLMHSLVFPNPVAPVLAARIGESLRLIERWASGALRGDADTVAAHARRQRIAAVVAEFDMLDSYLAWDPTLRVGAADTVRVFRWRLLLMLPIVASIRDRVRALHLAGPLDPELEQVLRAIAAWLRNSVGAAGRGGSEGDVLSAAAALRGRIDGLEGKLDAGADWSRILTASLLLRLRDLTELWQDGKAIEQHVLEPETPRPAMVYPTDTRASAVRLVDRGMAVWSAGAAILAVLVCCALWITAGWADGAVAAEMVAVTCCFFAARDNPVPFIVGFLKWTLLALVLDFIFLFGVLPAVHDFPVLVVVLAPVYLVGGVMMAIPALSFVGMAVMVNGATLLSLQSAYSADFPSFVNVGLAAVIGMAIAAVMTAITRSVGAEWSARRLMRQAWLSLRDACLQRGHKDRAVFAAHMLDRLGQLMPRLVSADAENDTAPSALMSALRVGLNIVDLRRARHGLPQAAIAAIDAMLDSMAGFFQARAAGRLPDPAPLLGDIDAALAAIAGLGDSEAKCDALLGLVGVRASLLPDAPPYRVPPRPPHQDGRPEAETEAA